MARAHIEQIHRDEVPREPLRAAGWPAGAPWRATLKEHP